MNTYNINDADFRNSQIYKNFMSQNQSTGSLKIRAYAASQAIPISGLKIVVSTIYGDDKIIFFEGITNESGIIERISLPAPRLDPNNLDVPNKITYEILATYAPDNLEQTYKVNIYENVYVVQNINIVPEMRIEVGGM